MYAAIWIDDSKKRANEKIVVCHPLLGRLNTAIAVLRSQKRSGAPSIIISGDGTKIGSLIAKLDTADEAWDARTSDQLITEIASAAKSFGLSVVDQGEVTAAIRRMPKPKEYPLHITKEAKPVWDMITVEHRDALDQYKEDKPKMWALALILLQRYAKKLNIEPFSKDPDDIKLRRMSAMEFHKRANNGNVKALEIISEAFDYLHTARIAARITGEQFYESAKHKSLYYITTIQIARLNAASPGQAIQSLRMIGWGGTGKYAHRNINSLTDVLAEPEGKDLAFFLTTRMTRDEVILLFGFSEDASDDKILKIMSSAGRRWVKTGILVEIPR